jgi:tetratricopeptide (TPR) repeat protein
LALSALAAHGQSAAAQLLQQGDAAMGSGDYATAAKDYDTIVTTYPSTANIEDITLRGGYANLHAGKFAQAISDLQKLTPEGAKPEFRGNALYFTGLALFSQAHTLADQGQSMGAYRQANETFSTLLSFIPQHPGDGNADLTEDAMYYLALSAYGQGPAKYGEAETDLNNLLSKFGTSLQKPDYLLLLGSIYAVQAADAITARAPKDQIRAAAQKASDTFDQVINDPHALVQANEAKLDKGNLYYLIASLDLPDTSGYAKALEVFRGVHRKQDMVELQQAMIAKLRAAQQNAVQNGGLAVGSMNDRLLDRETGRLNELVSGSDPIVQALIRMADCYVAMRQPDETRTILRRLRNITLAPDQQQDVDFQFLYSYTLGGQAEKADAALDDYLKKHPGDAQADSISVQVAASLMKRNDFAGALQQAQRSLKDYPAGKHVPEAIELESEALTKLKRLDEAKTVIDNFMRSNPNSPAGYGLLVTQGEGELARGDLAGALASFAKVKDNRAAGAFEAAAAAYTVQVLSAQQRYDDVIKAAQDYQQRFPRDQALPSVEILGALAMDKKGDPAAIAALQKVAKENPQNVQVGSFALYYLTMIYQRQNKVVEMTQAAKDLASSFPTAYTLIEQADDAVIAALEKQKKFDDAIALEQPMLSVPAKDEAARAQNRTGDIWLDAAKAMGFYQSLQAQTARDEAERRLKMSEQSYLATLKTYPDQVDAVGDAFQGLANTGQQRVKWGLLKESDLEDYLTKVAADLTTTEMQARLAMAKAGLVFVVKNGRAHDAAALAQFDQALAGSPNLVLTMQEADQYGELLLAAKEYPKAQDVYQKLLDSSKPGDQVKLAEGYYGMAATYLAQGDYANAKSYLDQMMSLPGGAAWSKHATEAHLAMAEINEQSSAPADQAAAKAAYGTIMSSAISGGENQAKSMLGYGRLLEKSGRVVKQPGQQDIEYATHYYEQVNLFYGAAYPELSAQGLYLAGQAYGKAGDAANAAKDFNLLRTAYAKTAPDWVAKAPAQ